MVEGSWPAGEMSPRCDWQELAAALTLSRILAVLALELCEAIKV